MNQDQVLGAARNILALLGGYAIGHGWLSGEQLTLISGAIAAVIPLVWSFMAHTTSAKLAAVEAMPEVKQIVVKATADNGVAEVASNASRPKVVRQ